MTYLSYFLILIKYYIFQEVQIVQTKSSWLDAYREIPWVKKKCWQIVNNRVNRTSKPLNLNAEVLTIEKLYENAEEVFLGVHNKLRANHEVPKLHLSSQLSAYSKERAEKLAKERQLYTPLNSKYGENVYSENYYSGLGCPGLIVHYWYSEVDEYKSLMLFRELHTISNFTQIIWRTTAYLGVGYAFNKPLNEVYVVCSYDPPGNVMQEFHYNIFEPVINRDFVNGIRRRILRNRPNLDVWTLLLLVATTNVLLFFLPWGRWRQFLNILHDIFNRHTHFPEYILSGGA